MLGVGRFDWGHVGIANDTLSSLRLGSAVQVTRYADTHFQGRSKTYFEAGPALTGTSLTWGTTSTTLRHQSWSNIQNSLRRDARRASRGVRHRRRPGALTWAAGRGPGLSK